jgi:hypothetical protein
LAEDFANRIFQVFVVEVALIIIRSVTRESWLGHVEYLAGLALWLIGGVLAIRAAHVAVKRAEVLLTEPQSRAEALHALGFASRNIAQFSLQTIKWSTILVFMAVLLLIAVIPFAGAWYFLPWFVSIPLIAFTIWDRVNRALKSRQRMRLGEEAAARLNAKLNPGHRSVVVTTLEPVFRDRCELRTSRPKTEVIDAKIEEPAASVEPPISRMPMHTLAIR